MDSPLLPRTSQSSSAAGNLFDESVESKFDDLSFADSSVAASPPPAASNRPAFLPPQRATNKPRFSLFAPGATALDPSPPPRPLVSSQHAPYRSASDVSAASSAGQTSSTAASASARLPLPPAASSFPSAAPPASQQSTPQHPSSRLDDEPLTVSQLSRGGSAAEADADDGQQQQHELAAADDDDESADATLRRTLYELQGFNKLFDKLLSARQGVNAVHEVRLSLSRLLAGAVRAFAVGADFGTRRSPRRGPSPRPRRPTPCSTTTSRRCATRTGRSRSCATLDGPAQRTCVSPPLPCVAPARARARGADVPTAETDDRFCPRTLARFVQDAIHMQTLMATLEREREELRQQTARIEEDAQRAREQAERERAAADELAARRREGAGAGGRGGAERGRGVPRGSLRGSRGRGAPGAFSPSFRPLSLIALQRAPLCLCLSA